MRKIYTFVMCLLVPAMLLRLLWKSRRSPAYRQRIAERFVLRKLAQADVWIHAVSMGEVVAVTPLVERLIANNVRVLMTTMTPTGSQQIVSRFKSQVAHQYIPYDLPWCFRRFLNQVKPKIGIIMETELWPNMICEAYSAGVPMVLANARLSDKAYPKYHFFRWFFAPLLTKFTWIGTQSELDSQRYQVLGAPAEKVMMLGNLKFDLSYPQTNQNHLEEIKNAWGAQRPVWIAASTHEDEEAQLLSQLSRIQQAIPNIVFAIAPRRPERFQTVYALAQQQGWNTGLRSQIQTIQPENDVVILDTMGELLAWYRLSDYAFVGGSLITLGGHNVLEPIAMQVPVFCGPFMQNSKSVCDELVKHQALQMCASAEEIADNLIALHEHPTKRAQQIARASAVLHTNAGAVERYLENIEAVWQ